VDSHSGNALVSFADVAICFGYGDVVILVRGDTSVRKRRFGLGFRLGCAHRLLRAAWEEAIADLRLSPPQAAVLRMVARWPGCGLREGART